MRSYARSRLRCLRDTEPRQASRSWRSLHSANVSPLRQPVCSSCFRQLQWPKHVRRPEIKAPGASRPLTRWVAAEQSNSHLESTPSGRSHRPTAVSRFIGLLAAHNILSLRVPTRVVANSGCYPPFQISLRRKLPARPHSSQPREISSIRSAPSARPSAKTSASASLSTARQLPQWPSTSAGERRKIGEEATQIEDLEALALLRSSTRHR